MAGEWSAAEWFSRFHSPAIHSPAASGDSMRWFALQALGGTGGRAGAGVWQAKVWGVGWSRANRRFTGVFRSGRLVGAARFELATSCTPSKRASRATLRPDRNRNQARADSSGTFAGINDEDLQKQSNSKQSNSKHQTPNSKLQTPNSKLQRNSNVQAPNPGHFTVHLINTALQPKKSN